VKPRAFLVYAIVTSLAEQAGLLVVLLLVLPSVGVVVPRWGVILAVAVLGTVSVVLTWLNLRAIRLKPACSPDVGVYGRVVKTLAPRGYVRVGNELWPAASESGVVESGAQVVVVRMEGLRLVVERADEQMHWR
jgi:membrane protein implicated in regulation of membrane protease activity